MVIIRMAAAKTRYRQHEVVDRPSLLLLLATYLAVDVQVLLAVPSATT
jgi:hypothetical protein